MYTIIEDCSPYYITFTFPGLEDLVDYIKSQTPTVVNPKAGPRYTQVSFDLPVADLILKKLPMYNQFNWMQHRVSVFSTPRGKASSIHKDGGNHRASFNIPLTVLDDKCKTAWYSDTQFGDKKTQGEPYSRIIHFNRHGYDSVPKLKEMVAKPNQMILFNTDIFHSWDNSKSTNTRSVLTMRVSNADQVYFDDIKKILFGE